MKIRYLYVGKEIVGEHFLLLALLIFLANAHIQASDESTDEAAFPVIPQPFGNVAEAALKEQHKTHPLIIRIVLFRFFVVEVVRYARMRHFDAYLAVEGVGHREGGRDPAESVNGMGWESAHDALDGIADVLGRRDDHRTPHQHRRREEVVQPEYGAVRRDRLPFQIVFEPSEESQHPGVVEISLLASYVDFPRCL